MLCTENLNSTFIIKSKLVISKLLVSPLLSSTIVEQRPLVPFWGFCPPGTGEICRRPTDRREVIEGGVKTIEGWERQLYNCYKGSQIALNTLNINVLYVFKGSRRLHINCRLLCVTC